MHALISMDPAPISAAAATSASSTDHGAGMIKKSLLSSSDGLHRVDHGKEGPMAPITLQAGNNRNDVMQQNKPHDVGEY